MSIDQSVTKQLIQTNMDGRDGFSKGAEKLEADGSAELASTFRRYSQQRAEFASELEKLAAEYGDEIDESGSIAAKVHRGWLSVKDVLAGSDPGGVLDVAEQGESHAVSEYESALSEDISTDLRAMIERQFSQVKAAHDEISGLRST